MTYDPAVHHRRSIRLQGYDYSQAGAYFITICTENRECLFGEIVDGQMRLNDAGRMIQTEWDKLPVRFNHLESDAFVIMPNHIHGIVMLDRRGDPCDRPEPCDYQKSGEHKVRPYGTSANTIGRIVQAFKSIVTHEYINGVKLYGWPPFPARLWQRNYWEHVVRDETDLNILREYINNNPKKWDMDKLHPAMPVFNPPATRERHDRARCAVPLRIHETMAEFGANEWMI